MVTTLGTGLDYIDLQFLGERNIIASGLLSGREGVAIVDPGPSTTLPALKRALAERGVELRDVRAILITHLHLDHAGAAVLAGSTKRMFNTDKQALDEEREQFTQRQKNEYQMMKKSALLSVENLSKAYPNFSKTEVAKIRNILVEGKIDNLFTKTDGSYNEDAAELVAYAVYGKKMLESVKKMAVRSGESKANPANS